MSSINEPSRNYLAVIIISLLVGPVVASPGQSLTRKSDSLAIEILQRATNYVENGDYEKAALIYQQFEAKFSTHPYADDAAYRLAYLHIIADNKNPYFNYEKAVVFFENFIETYPNSRYIMACKNWLNLLKRTTPAPVDPVEPVIIKVKENADQAVVKQLNAEIRTLKEENERLKQMLDELQRAIER